MLNKKIAQIQDEGVKLSGKIIFDRTFENGVELGILTARDEIIKMLDEVVSKIKAKLIDYNETHDDISNQTIVNIINKEIEELKEKIGK